MKKQKKKLYIQEKKTKQKWKDVFYNEWPQALAGEDQRALLVRGGKCLPCLGRTKGTNSKTCKACNKHARQIQENM